MIDTEMQEALNSAARKVKAALTLFHESRVPAQTGSLNTSTGRVTITLNDESQYPVAHPEFLAFFAKVSYLLPTDEQIAVTPTPKGYSVKVMGSEAAEGV